MRRYPKKGGQFAIIWVDLLYEDSVPQSAKILFGEIYRLSDADGWCDASNEDFMDLLGCSENTVRNLLKALSDIGQIRIQTEPKRDGKGGTVRRIFCGRKLAPPDTGEVPPKNCSTPKYLEGVPPKNCEDTLLKSNKRNNTPLNPPKGKKRKSKSVPDWKPERFEKFWAFYRDNARGEDRPRAVQEWDKLRPDDQLIDTMAKALQAQVATDEWKRGIGIPYACRWLKNERWKDSLRGASSEEAPEAPQRRYIGTKIVNGEEVDVYE